MTCTYNTAIPRTVYRAFFKKVCTFVFHYFSSLQITRMIILQIFQQPCLYLFQKNPLTFLKTHKGPALLPINQYHNLLCLPELSAYTARIQFVNLAYLIILPESFPQPESSFTVIFLFVNLNYPNYTARIFPEPISSITARIQFVNLNWLIILPESIPEQKYSLPAISQCLTLNCLNIVQFVNLHFLILSESLLIQNILSFYYQIGVIRLSIFFYWSSHF